MPSEISLPGRAIARVRRSSRCGRSISPTSSRMPRNIRPTISSPSRTPKGRSRLDHLVAELAQQVGGAVQRGERLVGQPPARAGGEGLRDGDAQARRGGAGAGNAPSAITSSMSALSATERVSAPKQIQWLSSR